MILLNFSHPFTDGQVVSIEALTEQKVEQIVSLPVQFNNEQPFEPQLHALMKSLPLTSEELQTKPILVNLPSFNAIAALLLAELHGRLGYFPPVLRLRPVSDSTPQRFEVAEIINLQKLRDLAREKRR